MLIVAAPCDARVAGAADNVSSIFRNTMVQAAVPDAIRGRLQGVFIVVVAGGPRLGALYAGHARDAHHAVVPAACSAASSSSGLVALLVRLNPRFRAYDAEHPEP